MKKAFLKYYNENGKKERIKINVINDFLYEYFLNVLSKDYLHFILEHKKKISKLNDYEKNKFFLLLKDDIEEKINYKKNLFELVALINENSNELENIEKIMKEIQNVFGNFGVFNFGENELKDYFYDSIYTFLGFYTNTISKDIFIKIFIELFIDENDNFINKELYSSSMNYLINKNRKMGTLLITNKEIKENIIDKGNSINKLSLNERLFYEILMNFKYDILKTINKGRSNFSNFLRSYIYRTLEKRIRELKQNYSYDGEMLSIKYDNKENEGNNTNNIENYQINIGDMVSLNDELIMIIKEIDDKVKDFFQNQIDEENIQTYIFNIMSKIFKDKKKKKQIFLYIQNKNIEELKEILCLNNICYVNEFLEAFYILSVNQNKMSIKNV